MKKALIYLNRTAAIIFIMWLGYLRDFFFVNINYRLSSLYYQNYDYQLPPQLRFVEGFDYMELYYMKYVFTGISFALFCLSACWAVYAFFREKKYLRWVLYSYIIVILAGGLTFLCLYWFLGFDKTYLFVRHIVDPAESPVLPMILITAIYLHKRLSPAKKQPL